MPSPYTTANLRPDFVPSVRMPVRASLSSLIGKMPFWVDLFNENLPAQQSDENRFTMTENFWWVASMASVTLVSGAAIVHPAFAAQLFEISTDGQTAETNQQKPVNGENFFGTAKEPFYLTKPLFLPVGTQVLCRVQSLQAPTNVSSFQIVMMGYMQ